MPQNGCSSSSVVPVRYHGSTTSLVLLHGLLTIGVYPRDIHRGKPVAAQVTAYASMEADGAELRSWTESFYTIGEH